MKYVNLWKYIAVILVVVCITSVLVSCGTGKLSGTYVAVDSFSQVTKLDFKGNRVTVTDMSIQVRASYEIKDDRLIISGTTTLFGTEVAVDYNYAFEKKGNSIFLDGKEYVKQ